MYVIDKGLVVEIINQMFGSCENYTTYYRFFFFICLITPCKTKLVASASKDKVSISQICDLSLSLSVPNHIKDVSFLTIVKV